MSLGVEGVWAVGVWNETVWASDVWREGAYTPTAANDAERVVANTVTVVTKDVTRNVTDQ